jgi:hypothetical protein
VADNNTNEKGFFNLEDLLNRTDGDKELACELMQMYLEQAAQNMAQIEDACSSWLTRSRVHRLTFPPRPCGPSRTRWSAAVPQESFRAQLPSWDS